MLREFLAVTIRFLQDLSDSGNLQPDQLDAHRTRHAASGASRASAAVIVDLLYVGRVYLVLHDPFPSFLVFVSVGRIPAFGPK